MPTVCSADGRGSRAVIRASWLALAVHQVTYSKHFLAHVAILEKGTSPHTHPALGESLQDFTLLGLSLTIIPTENKEKKQE